MSTELYIQGLAPDGEVGLAVSRVLDAFGASSDADNHGFHRAYYGTESYVDICLHVSDGKVVYVTAIRPVDHPYFWTGVFRLLTDGPYVAYMPGSQVVAASPDMQSAMPTSMIQALGKPILVNDADEARNILTA